MSESVSVIVMPRGGGDPFTPRWSRVYVRKSLDEICTYLEIETSPADRPYINTHDGIQVRYSNDRMKKQADPKNQSRPVGTGFVDDINLEVSAKRRTLRVTARSAARDIIDSTWSGDISSSSLLQIAKYIAQPYGIEVCHIPTTTDGTKLVTSFAWENESPWQKLIQEADNQGYLITSNQVGGLYVWPVASGSRLEGFSLEEGKGIVSLKDHESGSEQFHSYIFNGASKTVTKIDPACKTKRTLTINLSDTTMDEAALDRRIKTEILRRHNRRITVGVGRWGLSDERLGALGDLTKKEVLWEINFFTPVKIPSLKLDCKMLVSQVEYKADANSMSCDIQLANPEAYR